MCTIVQCSTINKLLQNSDTIKLMFAVVSMLLLWQKNIQNIFVAIINFYLWFLFK